MVAQFLLHIYRICSVEITLRARIAHMRTFLIIKSPRLFSHVCAAAAAEKVMSNGSADFKIKTQK